MHGPIYSLPSAKELAAICKWLSQVQTAKS